MSLRRKRTASKKSSGNRNPSAKIDFSLDDLDDEPSKKSKRDDFIDSDDGGDSDDESSLDSNQDSAMSSNEDGEEDKETVDEKRVRMAREYLSKMERAEMDASSSDAASTTSSSDIGSDSDGDGSMEEEEKDRVGRRLARKRLKQQGLLEQILANKVRDSIDQKWAQCQRQQHTSASVSVSNANDNDAKTEMDTWVKQNKIKLCRGHDLTPTSVALHASGSVAYSASKDNSILMWDVDTQTKLHTIVPKWNPKKCDYTRNSGEVLALAASDDGRYLAVGGRDATVKIYDVRQSNKGSSKQAAAATISAEDSNKPFNIRGIATTFEGHKGPVTALAFRSKSLQLYSGSEDRCIRHYNVGELAYIETLYGHQAAITGISCHGIRTEMPFSVARDRTARAWKLAEETHLIFRGGSRVSSADCISAIKDDWFLTGHDNGMLNLWLKDKKKPVATIEESHGTKSNLPRSLTSCASVCGSDLSITGSNDGYMRLWRVSTGAVLADRAIDAIGKIPMHGYVNDIAIGPKARFCVAALGQEPSLGRWDRIPCSKNRFAIIPLRDEKDQEVDDEINDEDDDGAEEEVIDSNSEEGDESMEASIDEESD